MLEDGARRPPSYLEGVSVSITIYTRKGEAYLRVTDLKAPYMFNLAEATGIDNISSVDGKPAVVYTLQGQRVTAPTKPGVYVVNGKKLVVK